MSGTNSTCEASGANRGPGQGLWLIALATALGAILTPQEATGHEIECLKRPTQNLNRWDSHDA